MPEVEQKLEQTADARYKFVVSSADEAVTVLRERLGEHAKVISVRQVEGAGLARFLRAPKLEVIARVEVPPPGAKTPAAPGAAAPSTTPETTADAPVDDLAPAPVTALRDEKAEALPVEEKLAYILLRAGFSESMLARFRAVPNWEKLVKMPLGSALTEISVILRRDYLGNQRTALPNRVAFIGTAGTGKTTALCKRLVTDVFFHSRKARVLKLEFDRPNPNDALSAFCEAMNVPLVRQASDAKSAGQDETLYVDFPGVTVDNKEEIAEALRVLDQHSISGRVLVVNAAYDVQLIKRAYILGEQLKATHVVFTHLDEIVHWGKLWEFILGQRLQPLFLSAGQNLAGDFSEQVFDSILERAFPSHGSKPAKAE